MFQELVGDDANIIFGAMYDEECPGWGDDHRDRNRSE